MSADIVRVKPPDPRAVELDRCLDAIERAIGRLGLDQRIAIRNAVDAFGDAVPRRCPRCDGW
ncbi:MAG TPA: hypothetical protein VL614_00600 [Acetobacteraceae bacterium]|jgi:hypothetical protein|nr:hypothetical protein [Acetobacteraceae bacterium]